MINGVQTKISSNKPKMLSSKQTCWSFDNLVDIFLLATSMTYTVSVLNQFLSEKPNKDNPASKTVIATTYNLNNFLREVKNHFRNYWNYRQKNCIYCTYKICSANKTQYNKNKSIHEHTTHHPTELISSTDILSSLNHNCFDFISSYYFVV